MKDEEWTEETRWRLGRVAEYFKPKEYKAIIDFITTATNERKREKAENG